MESTFDLAAVMTTSVQSIVSDLLAMVGAVLPVGLTVLGVSIGIAYGIKFIKKIVHP